MPYSCKGFHQSNHWILWMTFRVQVREFARTLKPFHPPSDIKDLFPCQKVALWTAHPWVTSWARLISTNAWATFTEMKSWRMPQENKDACLPAWWLHLLLCHHLICRGGRPDAHPWHVTTAEPIATKRNSHLLRLAQFLATAEFDMYQLIQQIKLSKDIWTTVEDTSRYRPPPPPSIFPIHFKPKRNPSPRAYQCSCLLHFPVYFSLLFRCSISHRILLFVHLCILVVQIIYRLHLNF